MLLEVVQKKITSLKRYIMGIDWLLGRLEIRKDAISSKSIIFTRVPELMLSYTIVWTERTI